MNCKKAFIGACLIAVLSLLQTAHAAPPQVAPLPNMTLLVDAGPEQLAAFDRALRRLVPADYIRYGLGCVVDYQDGEGEEGCDIMRVGRPVPDDLELLMYYFNDANRPLMQKFEAARQRVRKQFPKEKVELHFSRYQERAPDCRIYNQPCMIAPYCKQFGSCSSQASSCARC